MINKAIRKIIISSVPCILLIFQSCSSSVETESREEVREVSKPAVKVKNIEAAEREYIKSSQIRSIEKIDFSINAAGKPLNSRKLSAQNFDRKGFLTNTFIYDKKGDVEYRYSYEYDKNENRIKTTRKNSDGRVVNYFTYEYNEHNNKVRAKRFNPDGILEEYYEYNYDSDGNLSSEDWYSADGNEVYRIENEYENNRKAESKTFDENGNLVYRYIFKYDDRGNIVEEVKYDKDDKQAGIIQYIYKYF